MNTQESQNIEFKSSWHDDYLKWICGFANAQGGKLIIGKDDKGNIVGVSKDALLFFKTKGEITSSEYAEKYKISDRTARTDLMELVDKELLVRKGEYKLTKFYFR